VSLNRVHRSCSQEPRSNDADDAGITGTMNGVTFHYYAVPSYRTLAAEHGMELVNVHDDSGVATYYLSRKSS
jgi:hypothetical protein